MGELAGRSWEALTAERPALRWWGHRQLKKPFFGRFMKPWRWPSEVNEAAWQRVAIASGSRAQLAAVLQQTTAVQPRGVVVCAHPMGLACKGFWLKYGHAQALLEQGFHVLAFDFNGFGESESTNFDWPADAISVGQWAKQRFPGLPVHALTASFGAMHLINAMPRADFPYQRIVAEGCAPNLPMFWKAYPFAHFMLKLGGVVMPSIERGLRPEVAIASLPETSRLLLIHSHGDHWTPVAHGDRLAAAAAPNARLQRLTLASADHTHGMRDEPQVYWPAVRDFFLSD
ncbi:alpha/beta hydrolase [Pelomonas sp. SE-A7]|uniref:alpha/beta hydrolase n=1 Tax=Pelomonas sp. SE-A7 TaxID=3054953 RepID=UPI00259C98D9|nr:alpha/beta hydrolase [Pelomonas sp. SE-A7]MDM4766371.1 alpha/beta fold hydrolase [Pelomonas sp. SE-A7]